MSSSIAVIRRFIEQYQSSGDQSVARELLANDFTDHTPFPGFGSGRQDVMDLFRMMRAAFPDLRAEIIEQFAADSRVATRKNFIGTHLGAFAGIAPTGRTITIRVMDIVEIVNGQIREHWNVVDVAGLMDQLKAD